MNDIISLKFNIYELLIIILLLICIFFCSIKLTKYVNEFKKDTKSILIEKQKIINKNIEYLEKLKKQITQQKSLNDLLDQKYKTMIQEYNKKYEIFEEDYLNKLNEANKSFHITDEKITINKELLNQIRNIITT